MWYNYNIKDKPQRRLSQSQKEDIMSDSKCTVSWCNGRGTHYEKFDRVTKAGQTSHKNGYQVGAHEFYKAYFWICANHNNGNFSNYREDKNYDKFENEAKIAWKIYDANWGGHE